MKPKKKAKVARLTPNVAGKTKARVEKDLARIQEALIALEEGRLKAKEDLTRVQEALAAVGEGRL